MMSAIVRYTPAIAALLLTALTLPGQKTESYRPVTNERLLNPEPANWLMYRGNYEGWGYSPLSEINTENVKNLAPVWCYSTGVVEGHESPPIVNDGFMFLTTPENQVLALDARTGDLRWRYKRELPDDLQQLHRDGGEADPQHRSSHDPDQDSLPALTLGEPGGCKPDDDRIVAGEHQVNHDDLEKRCQVLRGD